MPGRKAETDGSVGLPQELGGQVVKREFGPRQPQARAEMFLHRHVSFMESSASTALMRLECHLLSPPLSPRGSGESALPITPLLPHLCWVRGLLFSQAGLVLPPLPSAHRLLPNPAGLPQTLSTPNAPQTENARIRARAHDHVAPPSRSVLSDRNE